MTLYITYIASLLSVKLSCEIYNDGTEVLLLVSALLVLLCNFVVVVDVVASKIILQFTIYKATSRLYMNICMDFELCILPCLTKS